MYRQLVVDPHGRLGVLYSVSRDVPAALAGDGLTRTQLFLGLQNIAADMTKLLSRARLDL